MTLQGLCREYCCVVNASAQAGKVPSWQTTRSLGNTVTNSSWFQNGKCQENQDMQHTPESGCAQQLCPLLSPLTKLGALELLPLRSQSQEQAVYLAG